MTLVLLAAALSSCIASDDRLSAEGRALLERATRFHPGDGQSLVEADRALKELNSSHPGFEDELIRAINAGDMTAVDQAYRLTVLDAWLAGDYAGKMPREMGKTLKKKPDAKAQRLVRLYWAMMQADPEKPGAALAVAQGLHFFVTRTSVPRSSFFWTGFNLASPRTRYRGGDTPRTVRELAAVLPGFQKELRQARELIGRWVETNSTNLVYACFPMGRSLEPRKGNHKAGIELDDAKWGFCTLEEQTLIYSGRFGGRRKQ